MENEYEFKNYKEKQAHFKRVNKERGKFLFVSKYPHEYKNGIADGRTYKKSKRIIMKEGEK